MKKNLEEIQRLEAILEGEIRKAIDESEELPEFYRDMIQTQFKIPKPSEILQKQDNSDNKRKNLVFSRQEESTMSNIS